MSAALAWYITPAALSDSQGAQAPGGLAFYVPHFKRIWANAACRGKGLAEWCRQQGDGWELEIVERNQAFVASPSNRAAGGRTKLLLVVVV